MVLKKIYILMRIKENNKDIFLKNLIAKKKRPIEIKMHAIWSGKLVVIFHGSKVRLHWNVFKWSKAIGKCQTMASFWSN